jgi:hypothetical protein
MNENIRADLDKLDVLGNKALRGPEETRDQSRQAYEELRSDLLGHEQCEGCNDDKITKDLEMKDKDAETTKTPDKDKAKDFDWESNKDNENPENLPWPEENETKE